MSHVQEKQDMITKNENNILKRDVDRLEQYGRRHSVVIRDIPTVEGESMVDLTEKVKNPQDREGLLMKSHLARYNIYKNRKSSKSKKISISMEK